MTRVARAVAGLCYLVTAAAATACTAYSSQSSCTPAQISPSLPECFDLQRNPPQQLFAIIGDYGMASSGCEANVAALIDQMEAQFGELSFIATVGDNNYWEGSCDSMHDNVGQFYGRFFYNGNEPSCTNRRNVGDPPNLHRFWPSLGNHDWDKYHSRGASMPYLQYFSYLKELGTSGGLYYNKSVGNQIELFALNSNYQASDPEFNQMKDWLQQALHDSTATYKLVYFHHPPYTTAQHDAPGVWMRWPYKEWGATMVLSGHQHTYERLVKEDFTYIVNGLGGHHWLYSTASMSPPYGCNLEPGSVKRYNAAHGALLGSVDHSGVLKFCFYSVENGGSLIDSFDLSSAASSTPSPTVSPTQQTPPSTNPPSPASKPTPIKDESDSTVTVLLIVASVMSVLAILAVVGGLYLRRKLQDPSSLFRPASGIPGQGDPDEHHTLFPQDSASFRRLGDNSAGINLKPDELMHPGL